jgi:hypothetical protein
MSKMRVLIACEFSGIVRDAFLRRGHDAWSCDLLPTESPGPHIQGDVLPHLTDGWDLMIAHPPCTHLASSGARWFSAKRADGRQAAGVAFFLRFTETNISRVCVENPVGIMSKLYRKPDQIIQPWQFGDPETKATCLWLRGLPPLIHYANAPLLAGADATVEPDYMRKSDGSYYRDKKGKRYSRVHFLSRSNPDRWKERSRTYMGIAEAMAQQWSQLD